MIRHAFNIATKLKQSRLRFLISNSAASLHDVDDGQTDDPANILEDTDSDKELEKERQEWSKSGRLRSKKAKAKPWVMPGLMNKEGKCSAEPP